MRWHSWAHLRQASAQRLHRSMPHFSHSAAQRSQISAQARQRASHDCEPRAQAEAQVQQVWAQSMHARAQSALLSRHESAHSSQTRAHATHASKHDLYSPLFISFFFNGSIDGPHAPACYSTRRNGRELRLGPRPKVNRSRAASEHGNFSAAKQKRWQPLTLDLGPRCRVTI